jgi:hypothetical protein
MPTQPIRVIELDTPKKNTKVCTVTLVRQKKYHALLACARIFMYACIQERCTRTYTHKHHGAPVA